MDGGRARRVSELMSSRLVGIHPSAKVEAALRLLKSSNVGLIPVIRDGRLMGVLDDKLLFRYEAEAALSLDDPVEKAMREPVFVSMNAGINESIRYLLERGLTRLPVVDSEDEMRCVGVVSATELLSAKMEE